MNGFYEAASLANFSFKISYPSFPVFVVGKT